MEYITDIQEKKTAEISDFLEAEEGTELTMDGAVHRVRDLGEIMFLILRRREGLVQVVCGKKIPDAEPIRQGDCVRVKGMVKNEARAPFGRELKLEELKHLSRAGGALPLPVDKWKLQTSLETKLSRRPLVLRNVRERAKFRIQEGIVRAFRDYLYGQGFTEIHTPKTGARSAEGGANLFRFSYFHRPAVLQQSPQLYKQMMVGVFDRVFETGPVFRAEKHNTRRHLNEYTSLDLEMGYIENFLDICRMEAGFLRYMTAFLEKEYSKELEMLSVVLPDAEHIPCVRFEEAKRLAAEKYHRKMKNPVDLEPEEEEYIGKYFQEEYGADFVFVTHYPSVKRPFYAMDDPEDPKYTLSFDLLFRGMEITTGGQRIHTYEQLVKKMEQRGMTQDGLESYLDTFRYGMPPHGGLGIGLERLTMQLLGEDNVREVCMFPRDMSRLEP